MPKAKPYYLPTLKTSARQLRSEQTPQELALWEKLRRKQIHGVPFYRQKPILRFIVDFYAPSIKLIVELDGTQHFTAEGKARDAERDVWLSSMGFAVLRFGNHQVDSNLSGVVERISRVTTQRLGLFDE